ncbi:hypothetical protein [Sphingomonas sp. Leaf242]|uniref:hypothetical protein n=1 Tax=Sphingomonas sp. Leaf242 TaxID=1736304 RepID=UPI003FA7C1B2
MSEGPPPQAARFADPVAHSQALGGFVAGALIGLAAAAGVAIVVGMAATAIAARSRRQDWRRRWLRAWR